MSENRSETTANDASSSEFHGLHACSATGCPIPGTISQSTNGDGGWLCFVHAATRASMRDHVTAKIRENIWIFRLYERVLKSDMYHWNNVRMLCQQFCERKNTPQLAPQPDENRSFYERRLRVELENRCRPPKQVDALEIQAAKKAKQGVQTLAEFLPEVA